MIDRFRHVFLSFLSFAGMMFFFLLLLLFSVPNLFLFAQYFKDSLGIE